MRTSVPKLLKMGGAHLQYVRNARLEKKEMNTVGVKD